MNFNRNSEQWSKYPWDRLTNGQPHYLTLEELGASSWTTFRAALYAYAKTHGLVYRARHVDGGLLRLQMWGEDDL